MDCIPIGKGLLSSYWEQLSLPIGKPLVFLLGKVSPSYKEVSCLPIRKGGGFLIGRLSCSQSLYASRHGKRPGKKMLPSLLVCNVCAMPL